MPTFTPLVAGNSVTCAATAASAGSAITCTGANALHIANTSAPLYASVRWGETSQTATLGTSLTLPPEKDIVVDIPANTAFVAAISTGNTANVVFTAGRSL